MTTFPLEFDFAMSPMALMASCVRYKKFAISMVFKKRVNECNETILKDQILLSSKINFLTYFPLICFANDRCYFVILNELDHIVKILIATHGGA